MFYRGKSVLSAVLSTLAIASLAACSDGPIYYVNQAKSQAAAPSTDTNTATDNGNGYGYDGKPIDDQKETKVADESPTPALLRWSCEDSGPRPADELLAIMSTEGGSQLLEELTSVEKEPVVACLTAPPAPAAEPATEVASEEATGATDESAEPKDESQIAEETTATDEQTEERAVASEAEGEASAEQVEGAGPVEGVEVSSVGPVQILEPLRSHEPLPEEEGGVTADQEPTTEIH